MIISMPGMELGTQKAWTPKETTGTFTVITHYSMVLMDGKSVIYLIIGLEPKALSGFGGRLSWITHTCKPLVPRQACAPALGLGKHGQVLHPAEAAVYALGSREETRC